MQSIHSLTFMKVHDMLTYSFEHRNMITCIYSVIYTQTGTCSHNHTVNLITNSQVHSLKQLCTCIWSAFTHTSMHGFRNRYTLTSSHRSSWFHIHSEVNMLPSCTCLQIHSKTWTHRNTQKHINTLTYEQAQFTPTHRQAHIRPQSTHSLKWTCSKIYCHP